MCYVKKNEATIPPSWPNKHLSYGQRDLFLAGPAQGVPCGAWVANQNRAFVLSCSLEILQYIIRSVVGRPCHTGSTLDSYSCYWWWVKKNIDDAYDDSEYHAPNNDVRHSETTNYANIRSSTSRLQPLFQSEAKCEDIDMKMFFILMQIKLIFTTKVLHLVSFWKWNS